MKWCLLVPASSVPCLKVLDVTYRDDFDLRIWGAVDVKEMHKKSRLLASKSKE